MSIPLVLLLFLFSFALPLSALAQAPAQLLDLEGVIGSLVSALITFAGIGCLIFLVMGGFQYLGAGADKEGAARARRTITYALIGLLVTASSFMVLSLIGTFLGIPNLGILNLRF